MSENKQAQAEEITLTLDPEETTKEEVKQEEVTVTEKDPIDEANLTETERKTR